MAATPPSVVAVPGVSDRIASSAAMRSAIGIAARRLEFILVCGLLAALFISEAPVGALAQTGSAASPDEYRQKAAFIYNLAKFVEWPAGSFPDATTSLTVCVLGVDPFGALLDEAMSGRSVAGRTLTTRRVTSVDSACHVLFVADSETKRLPAILEQLRGRSVLSIAEDPGFLDQGGIVTFSRPGEPLRLAISSDAAEQAHLKVSARVLSLSAVGRVTGATP